MSEVNGLRVLIVEDEELIAMMAEDMLAELGCSVSGTAHSVAEALTAIDRGGFDVVLLDVNLAGEDSGPVSQRLRIDGHRFIVSSGYSASGIPSVGGSEHKLAKPYRLAELKAAMEACVADQDGTSSTTSISDSKRG